MADGTPTELKQRSRYHGAVHLAIRADGQEAAEKALQGFLYAQGEELVVGYSVEALCRWATEFDADSDPLREAIAPLGGYCVPTRYPNSLLDFIPARVYTRRAAEETLGMADQVLRAVRQKLGN